MVITDWNSCPHCLRIHPGVICAEARKDRPMSALFPEAREEAEAAREYSNLLKETQQLRIFVGFVESVVSNPIGAYSVQALDDIFGLMRDKIAALPK